MRELMRPVLIPVFLYACGVGAVAPILVLAALKAGATGSLAAAIVTAAAVAAMLFSAPAGMMITRLGERASMIIATIAVAIAATALVLVLTQPLPHRLIWFTAAVMVISALGVVIGLARQAFVAETVRPEFVGRALTAVGGAQRAGALVGPAVGSAMLLIWPLWSIFILEAVMVLAATVLMWNDASRSPRATEQSAPAPIETKPSINWRAVGFAGVATLTLAMARRGQVVILPLWGNHIGLSASMISIIVAGGYAVELIMMTPGGILKDTLGRIPVLITCLATLGLGIGLLSVFHGVVGMCLAILVQALGNGLGAGIVMTIGADLSPKIGRATFLGYWQLFPHAGSFAGPALISLMLAIGTLPVAAVVLGGITIGGAVWTWIFGPRMGLPAGTRSVVR